MDLLIAQSASVDLKDIQEYYSEQVVVGVGNEFIKSILIHLESLKDNPDNGRIVPEFEEKTLREIIHPPFRLVYLRGAHQVQVI